MESVKYSSLVRKRRRKGLARSLTSIVRLTAYRRPIQMPIIPTLSAMELRVHGFEQLEEEDVDVLEEEKMEIDTDET